MNEYLNQIEISGITYDLVASGGTESGVTPAEVQEMINQSISGMSGDINIISGDVKNISGDVISISGDIVSLSGDVQNISGDVIVLSGDVIALEAKVDTKMDKLPIYSGTGLNGLVYNFSGNTASGNYSHVEGYANRATNTASHAEGTGSLSSGGFAHAEGRNTQATQLAAHAEGTNTIAKGADSHAEGTNTIANNQSEHASGFYNVSRTGSTSADKTLFSVGNGTSAERHNAFEIRQNGDIFISSGGTDIKLQDVIGQGGITSGDVVDIVSEYTYDKDTIDNKIASGGTFDPTLYYKKSETSGKTELSTEFAKYYKKTETSGKTEIQNALDLKLDASAFTESDYYKKTETSGKTELSTEFAKYYKKDETSGKTELSTEFAKYYKKDETSGKTELDTEFAKYYKKTETSSKTEIDDAFSAITKVIEDNEEVVARALNELNDKKVESGDVIDIVSGYTYSKAEIDDALDDKQDELVAGNNITISGNVISASSGTKYTAGRAINITTGATADTISFDLPIYSGKGTSAVAIGIADPKKASGYGTIIGGASSQATNDYSVAIGVSAKATGKRSAAFGTNTTAQNYCEFAVGYNNKPYSDTIFTVGNGIENGQSNPHHNALEIRQSGDIYIADMSDGTIPYYNKPMIKLQDALGQGGGITSGEVQTMIDQSISGKADSSDVYEKTETYSQTEIDTKIENKFWCGTESEWSQISGSTQSGTLYLIY